MEKQKQMLNGAPAEPEVNEYYLRISKKLRIAKYLSLLFMVAALILTLWAYRSRLTYDNFRYILRDIDEAGHTTLATDAVYYAANDTNMYLYFRGDLAVASSNGIAFHRALGSRSFEDRINFKSPVVTGSDKYMIAYDAGGNSFYVYNSISRVYNETLKHSVIDCAAADNGAFAVLTKSDVGDFVVRVYNKDFDLVGQVTRDGYAYLIGFLDDGRLYICEVYSHDATLYTDITLYTVGASEVDITVSVQGMVLEFDNMGDRYVAVSDRGVSMFDKDMNLSVSHSFGTSDVRYADITARGVCVMLDKNEIGADEEAAVYLADEDVYKTNIRYGAKGMVLCGKKAVTLYDEMLLVIDADGTSEIAIPNGAKKILLLDEKSVIVCYNDYAKVFEVN